MGQNLSRVLGWAMGGNAVTGVANFLSAVWFARVLGPSIMGTYAVILVAFQLMAAFLTPGFNQAIIRNPSKPALIAAGTFATFLQSVVMICASIVVYGMSFWVDKGRAIDFLVPGIGMLVSTVLSLWMYLLAVPFEAGLDYRTLVHIRMVALLVSTMTGILAVEAGFGVNALIARDVVSSLLSLVLIRLRSPIVLAWEGWREGIPDLVRFVRGLWPLNILERLVLRLDYAVVGCLFDIETLGIYFAVRGIVEGALGFTLSPIQTVLYSYYCRLPSINIVVDTLFRRELMSLIGLTTAGAILVFHLTGDGILAATLGPEYRRGYVLLGGLILYAVSVAWFEHLKVLAMSQDSHHAMMLARVVQLALSVILLYPLIHVLGLMGAGLSAGIAAATMAAISTWIARALRAAEGTGSEGAMIRS